MHVILDTNVYVSMAIQGDALEPIRSAWEAGLFTTVISSHLINEVRDVLGRPKLGQFVMPERAEHFIRLIVDLGVTAVVDRPYPGFRDPKDRYLLAMLRDSNAEILVTGDKALLGSCSLRR